MKILVVDDEASMRVTLAANLELEGFDVVEAKSGTEALAILEKNTFDVLLSDVRMPGMNGVELFRKARERRPDLPVVLMTAFAVEGLIDEAIQEGVYTILPKPFDLERVVASLARAGRGPLVLVVDDLPEVVDTAVAALRACGIRASGAKTAAEAIRAIEGGKVDVCVVDMVMPDMAGPDLIERICALDRSIACIAVSGQDVQEMFRRASAVGASACLTKPLDTGDLVRQIARARSVNQPQGGRT